MGRSDHLHSFEGQRRRRHPDHLRELHHLLPAQLAAIFNVEWLTTFANWCSTGWLNWLLTLLLIVFFAYFYTSMVFNPEETSDNIRKQGGFIPGVRPGLRPCST